MERRPDGTLQFRRPDGRLLPDVPQPAPVPDDPAGVLARHDSAGDGPAHRRLMSTGWFGERLDVGYVIDVAHPRAIGY